MNFIRTVLAAGDKDQLQDVWSSFERMWRAASLRPSSTPVIPIIAHKVLVPTLYLLGNKRPEGNKHPM